MNLENLKNQRMNYFTFSKGFSTLFVVILLGISSLTLVLSLSASGAWSVKGSINSKSSNQAKWLVNACAEIALHAIRENNNYVGNDSVVLENNTCNYEITNQGGNTRAINVSGSVGGITRNLNITTSSFNPLVISYWQEV